MRLFLNWIFQLYEILKQIIIVLEGITVINFIYNTFIKKKSEDNEEHSENINNDLILDNLKSELVKEKEHINELNSKLKNENNYLLIYEGNELESELVKERQQNNELKSKLSKEYHITSDLTYELGKEKNINLSLRTELEIEKNTIMSLVSEKEKDNRVSEITKNMNLKLDNLRCNLTREKRINDELKCELTKQSRMNDALKSKLSNSEYALSVVRRINNGLKHN